MAVTVFELFGACESLVAYSGFTLISVTIITFLYYLGKNVYVYFVAEHLKRTLDFKSLGQWAVVTGATDGIGKGYALDLARRGCNLILISRSQDKLDKTAKEIEQKYNQIETRTIAADFNDANVDAIYGKITTELRDLQIGVLVNNVGTGNSPEYFHKIPDAEDIFLRMIRVNCIAQTMMTHIVLPRMLKRRKGVIIHISSGAGINPIPFFAVYSATKAFNDFFGRALAIEYADSGIINQVINPYRVSTNLTANVKADMFNLDSVKFARSCLNSVGFFDRTTGHVAHALQNWAFALVPALVRPSLMLSTVKKLQEEFTSKGVTLGYKKD